MKTSQHIVAFSGHRSYDGSADDRLRSVVADLYAEGVRIFRVGMAEGFDLAAGEVVLSLMELYDDIVLEAYVPWPLFSARFDRESKLKYDAVIAKAQIIRYAGFAFQNTIFHQRNDMLVDGAGYLVAWWNGSRSGTGYTLNRARRHHAKIINLHPGSVEEQRLL
ncbi:MAG: DUF1273 family protein [Alistipes sp.]|nr:DUF1273 family protein [Alistipes sp.]